MRSEAEKSDPLIAMREDLGDEAFERFLTRFIDEADDLIGCLGREASFEGDLEALAAESHKLAGSAAMYGLLDLRDTMVDIEMTALAGRRSDLSALAVRSHAIWEAARASLRSK